MSRKRNWPEYNRNLINRGKITLWIDRDLAKNPFDKQKGRGRPRFSDAFLIAALCLRSVYYLSFRSLEGFLQDLMALLQIDSHIPSYTLYSKRMKSLELPKLSSRRPQHLLIDASGVKIFGEGEWKVKVHGKGKRRQWIKIHVGVDEKTQEIMAVKVTESNVSDCKVVEEILKGVLKQSKRFQLMVPMMVFQQESCYMIKVLRDSLLHLLTQSLERKKRCLIGTIF